MAIVADYYDSRGAHIRIHDDAYAGLSEEELERRRREVGRIHADVLYAIARRTLAEGGTIEELIRKIEDHRARREAGLEWLT